MRVDHLAFRIYSFFRSRYEKVLVEGLYRSFRIDRSFVLPPNVMIVGDIQITGPGYINGPGILYAGKGGKIVIGPNCEIANNCHMRAETHVPEAATGPTKEMRSGTIRIGSGVWIGANVFIDTAVTVGDGAVIGANSVVTRDVPGKTVVAGAPAREIRKLA